MAAFCNRSAGIRRLPTLDTGMLSVFSAFPSSANKIKKKQQSQYFNDLYPFICLMTEDGITTAYCNCSTRIKNQFVTRVEPTGQPLDEIKITSS